jgi:hypothetical protein
MECSSSSEPPAWGTPCTVRRSFAAALCHWQQSGNEAGTGGGTHIARGASGGAVVRGHISCQFSIPVPGHKGPDKNVGRLCGFARSILYTLTLLVLRLALIRLIKVNFGVDGRVCEGEVRVPATQAASAPCVVTRSCKSRIGCCFQHMARTISDGHFHWKSSLVAIHRRERVCGECIQSSICRCCNRSNCPLPAAQAHDRLSPHDHIT